jgi:hypothetical protein
MASVIETRGHTPVGQRDSDRLLSGNDKNMSENVKTRDGTVDDPVSAGPFIRIPRAERISTTRFTKINRSALRRKLSTPMFSIAIFLLMVMSPVLIPAAITAFHAIARQRRRERIAYSLGDGAGSVGGQPISHDHTRRAAVA